MSPSRPHHRLSNSSMVPVALFISQLAPNVPGLSITSSFGMNAWVADRHLPPLPRPGQLLSHSGFSLWIRSWSPHEQMS